MTNSLTRIPDPASQWFWNGSQWVCGCDPDDSGCPPPITQVPGFPAPFFPPPITQPPWYPGANGGVSFGVNPPPNPIRGAFWWNGVVLALFDGAAWVDTTSGQVINGGGGGGGGGGSGGQGSVIISSTPPGNPVMGEEWWDGTVLRVWDGTKWNIVGPGAAAGPVPTTTHTFRMTQPTTVTVPINTFAVVPFTATPQVDPQLAWNPTTFRITPTKAGTYLWICRGYLTAASGYAAVALVRNDPGSLGSAGIDYVTITDSTAPGQGWITTTGVSLMNGNTDYVRMWVITGDGNFYGFAGTSHIDAYLLP